MAQVAGNAATGARGWGFRMLQTGKWLVLISLGLLLLLPAASAQTAQTSIPPNPPKARHKARKAKVVPPPPVVLPPLPRGPLPQVPLDQLPTAPPQVDYRDGRLTIVAQNSTLSDILREVRKRTGASIDVPPSATEHVVARLGPAPAREVLATLLNGSSFNYVMVGSAADPAVLSSVVLTSKPAGGAQTIANVPQPVPVYSPPGRPGFGPGFGQPVGVVPTAVAPVIQPAPVVNQPAVNADASANDSQEPEDSEQEETETQDQNGATPLPNAGPKTPDEMLQMLQQQQQLQQPPQQTPPPQPGQPPQPNPQDD
jgi:hypothetical protein